MKLPLSRPGHPRRRWQDGLDAAFRLSLAFFLDWLWGFLVYLIATSTIRTGEEVVFALIGGLPLLAVNCYAFLTLKAYFDDRLWVRAQRMADSASRDEAPGTTSV